MPYNPQVTDISGQLRARGMSEGMDSLLKGFDVGLKTYQQNKHMADNAVAKFGAVLANSDSLKTLLTDEAARENAPKDVVKAYLKLQKEGNLGVRDASLLGAFAESYSKTEEDKQQRMMRAAQLQNMQMLMDQQKKQQAEEDQMNARMQQMAQLGRNMETGTAMLPPAPAGPAALMRGPAGPMALGGMDTLGRPGNLNGGGVLRPEMSEQAKEFLNTKAGYLASQGVRLNPTQMVDLAKTDQNAQSREAIARMKMQGGPLKLDKYRLDADGKTYEVTIDANTNREIARGTIKEPPRAYPTAEEAGEAELAKTSGSERAKNAVAYVQSVSDAAEGAQETLARIGQVRKLYEAGEVTGSGQGVLNDITGAAVRLGIYPRDKQGTKEALQSALAMDALQNARVLMKGQGSVSDKEREAIEKVSAGVGKTPEANLAILAISESLAKRSLEQEKKRRELYDKGMNPVQISEQLKRWRMDNQLPSFNITNEGAAAPMTADDIANKWLKKK